jgi:hypothetical protein
MPKCGAYFNLNWCLPAGATLAEVAEACAIPPVTMAPVAAALRLRKDLRSIEFSL